MTRNLVLRFAPVGRKHLKKYRLVIAQKFRSVNKLYIEVIGSYDPVSKQAVFNDERLKHYLMQNIEVSQSVQSLLKKHNYLQSVKNS